MTAAQAFADARTLDALDFAPVRLRVVEAARTERGRAVARELAPHPDLTQARLAQRRTAAVRDAIASADVHVLPAVDTAGMTQAATLGRTLGTTELRAVADAIAAAAAAERAVREIPALADILKPYVALHPLLRSLNDAIDERGNVLDRASPALGRIRRNLAQSNVDARDRVASILRSAKYAKAIQDHVVTIRDGRFVVPVKADFAGEFPGIVHDTSASGQTHFIEPLAALESNNRVRTLRIEEEREVARILEALSRRIGAEAEAIEGNVEMLAAIDVLVAKAEVARAMDAREPELVEEPTICIQRGRHPLLGARAVPQTLALDAQTRILLVSGPNMGGKTVALKMVGLFVAMAYAGLQLPAAAGTRLGLFTHLLADIGDEQSIAANASTFSAHLQRMRELLDRADARTLAVVDEIGGGTEPGAGAALATAILERLLACGTFAVVTTHATELKLFAHATPGVQNASVRFDPQTFAPTFELDIGSPGQSMAFPLARSMGIDRALVERADALLEGRERDYEAALAEVATRGAALQRERERLQAERDAAAEARAAIERERDALAAEKAAFGARAQERMAQALREFVADLQRRENARPKVTPAQTGALARAVEALRRDLRVEEETAPAPAPGTFERHDRVRVRSLAQEADVVEDYGDALLVAIGAMKTVVAKTDVERRGRAPKTRAQTAARARLDAATGATAELDVRGKRYVEAEPLVERWIDESILAGTSSIRLIHGKGTGMLGRGLQEYLRAHPAVQSVRYGNEDEGSSGVSIIALRG